MKFYINHIGIKKALQNLNFKLLLTSLFNIRYSSFKTLLTSLFNIPYSSFKTLLTSLFNIQYSSFNFLRYSKFLILSVLFFFSFNAHTQNYRLSVTSSNAYFSDFNKHSVLFSGYSASYFMLNNRFGFGVTYCHYFPKTYYGQVGFYDFTADKITKAIPVYAKGSANSFSFGISFDFLRLKSEKFKSAVLAGLSLFDHIGEIDNEPFLSVYGSSDNVSVSSGCFYAGALFIYKIGYVPVQLSIKRQFSIDKQKYSDFKIPGYFEINAGICFPIIKSPPPTKIKKVNY